MDSAGSMSHHGPRAAEGRISTLAQERLDRVSETAGEVCQSSSSLDCSQIDGARMAWLVHSDLATAGQAKAGEPPPPLLGDVLGELNALGAKVSHGGLYVVARLGFGLVEASWELLRRLC